MFFSFWKWLCSWVRKCAQKRETWKKYLFYAAFFYVTDMRKCRFLTLKLSSTVFPKEVWLFIANFWSCNCWIFRSRFVSIFVQGLWPLYSIWMDLCILSKETSSAFIYPLDFVVIDSYDVIFKAIKTCKRNQLDHSLK